MCAVGIAQTFRYLRRNCVWRLIESVCCEDSANSSASAPKLSFGGYMRELLSISIYTDGGCTGNPGPGAWAFIIPDLVVERSGYQPDTTNNRMELQAAIEALQYVAKVTPDQSCTIYTDSQYVQKGISTWVITWKRNNWKTSSKKIVKNHDLWLILDNLNESILPQWRWVQGHSGITENERCDFLVRDCIKKRR